MALTDSYRSFASLMRDGRYAEALALAEHEALNAGGRADFWHTQRANALIRMKRFEQARDAADEALRGAPNNPYAILAMADSLGGLGQLERACGLYEQVSHSRDSRAAARGQNRLLQCLGRRGEWEQVLALTATRTDPSGALNEHRARALHALGRDDEALEACRAWLEASPDNPRALWLQTEIDIAKEGLDTVRQRFSRLARIPSRPPIYGEIYASLCRRAGVPEAALGQYEKLQSRTTDPGVLRKKAFALSKAGREEEAVPLMEQLLRADPGDPYLHTGYIAACGRMGERQRPVQFYQTLLGEHPEHKQLYGWLKRARKQEGGGTRG
ncbi:MAG: tetratricopeptide repeat protein [Chitinivibrionales bacterium]|nr:tetratricopeptide repeat protein [Chitinivibrionales bacterium]